MTVFCLLFISERLITFFADSKIIRKSAVEEKENDKSI